MLRNLSSTRPIRLVIFGLVVLTLAVVMAVQIPFSAAQEQVANNVCPASVEMAMTTLGTVCGGTPSNNACYAHQMVDARIRQLDAAAFDEPGDTVALTLIDSLRLSAMDISNGTWGVAKLRLQAPAIPSQLSDVSVLLFGDVMVENTVPTRTALTASITEDVDVYVNVRLMPDDTSAVVRSLPPGTTVIATARVEDTSWIRVEIPANDRIGWVTRDLLRTEADLTELSVHIPTEPYYGPMQAFYFSSAAPNNNDACGTATIDGMVVQTPAGPAQVKVYINEVTIDLLPSQTGNTVFVQAQPDGDMTVSVLDGTTFVESQGIGQTAVAGSQVTIPLDSGLKPQGPVTPAQPYGAAAYEALPVSYLDYPVSPAAPATQEQIQDAAIYRNTLPASQPSAEQGSGVSQGEQPDVNAQGNTVAPSVIVPPAPPRDDDDDDDDDNNAPPQVVPQQSPAVPPDNAPIDDETQPDNNPDDEGDTPGADDPTDDIPDGDQQNPPGDDNGNQNDDDDDDHDDDDNGNKNGDHGDDNDNGNQNNGDHDDLVIADDEVEVIVEDEPEIGVIQPEETQ